MRLNVFSAVALALVAGLLPGCNRTSGEQSSRGASAGQTPSGGATGQASEGSTDDRKAPARPSSPTSR